MLCSLTLKILGHTHTHTHTHIYIYIYKGKVFPLRPGVAQRVGTGYSSMTAALEGVSDQQHAPAALYPPLPIVQEDGWAPGPIWTGRKAPPHRDSTIRSVVSRYTD